MTGALQIPKYTTFWVKNYLEMSHLNCDVIVCAKDGICFGFLLQQL